MEVIFVSFASRLRQAREQSSLTQQDLAEKLGITKSAIGNYENGVSSPKWDVLLKIFDVLKVEPNFLYQDSFSLETPETSPLTPQQSALLSSFDLLNEEGQSKVIGYAEDLCRTGYYKKDSASGMDKRDA
ncbi:MAG: helix-turn-helix domain-containing protein [Faecalibacterium sp.]